MENTSGTDTINTSTTAFKGLNLKATKLRLGLPGSDSPERGNENQQLGFSLNNNNNNSKDKSFVSGARRGFSVAIHGGPANWVFSGNAGSDPNFSLRGAHSGKEGFPHSSKAVVQENKSQSQSIDSIGKRVREVLYMAQVVGWPPIRSFRKNTMASHLSKNDDGAEAKSGSGCLYVKVSMDGAPYLRKVDLKTFGSYMELSSALEKMFSCFTIGECGSHVVPGQDGLSESRLMDLLHGSEYVLTYEDKDNDWMLVGDVPWKMFTDSCRRLRIMKGSEAIGLAPRAMEKCKSLN
ncbi:auxin-responsive protein IAA27-like isoform X4 [Populus alba x Populus x berolinensis]|nr:auxin-responsive protein IAA27-like isoform X4 [Populus alba x Populus x berolinensis]